LFLSFYPVIALFKTAEEGVSKSLPFLRDAER